MPSLFFGLLPTDLHIDILYVWLNVADCGSSLLKVLSALDVACPPSEQPSLRYLMEQLPPFGECTSTSNHVIQYASKCLRWLASRKVSAQTLLLCADNNFVLEVVKKNNLAEWTCPQIETLHCDGSAHLGIMMQCLPNLTAIHLSSSIIFTVDATHTPMLKELIIDGTPHGNLRPLLGTCLHLHTLRIANFGLTEKLACQLQECCPNLKILEVFMYRVDISHLLRLLRTCRSLEELVLHELDTIHLAEFAAFPNLRRLGVMGVYYQFQEIMNIFLSETWLWTKLDQIRTSYFLFSRKEARLEVLSYKHSHLSVEHTSRIFRNACCSIEVFSWQILVRSDAATLFVAELPVTLKSLTIRAEAQLLKPLLDRCGASLRHLDWHCGYVRPGPCPFALIAVTCPQLTSLRLRGCEDWTTEGFSAFASACTNLKELALEISHTTRRLALQAIIQHKLRLKLLMLTDSYFNTLDVVWFRQLAKDHQHLPVPIVMVTK